MSIGDYPYVPTIQGTSSPTGGSGNIMPLLSGGMQLLSDQLTNKQRRKLERETRKWNLEQWHRVNRYNHPTEQMARLTAAGLNPNLIYGSSPGSAVGNAGAVAPGQAPKYGLSNPMIPFMNTRVQQAQSNNLTADTMLKGTQSLKNAVDSGMKSRELDLLNAKFDDMVGITASEAAIKQVESMVKMRTRYSVIQKAFNENTKDIIAIRLAEWELKNQMSANMMRGHTIYNMFSALGIDINTPDGRKTASLISGFTLGSKIASSLSPYVRGMLKRSKTLVGTASKYYKKTGERVKRYIYKN